MDTRSVQARGDAADGRVLVITGASSGIGAATARRAAAAGYRLVLAARRQEALDELSAELGGDQRALAVTCDVTSWEQQEALVERALQHFGKIDAVFANAGTSAKMGVLEETPERWQDLVLTNVLGTAFTIRATLPHLLEQGSGHFVVTSSLAAEKVVPGSLYGATKAAVSSFTEAVRTELRQIRKVAGIRVTLIEAGAVATEMTPSQMPFEPLRADDVARAVVFALEQPGDVDLARLAIRPSAQPF